MAFKDDRLLKVEEVALSVGVSVKTINNWYWFKRDHPEHELAELLPDFIQEGVRQTRYWKRSDLWKLLEFKSRLPVGRNGIMGDITQRYYHNRKKKKRRIPKDEKA